MKIYADGGCFPNPGRKFIGIVFENGEKFVEETGHGTNNEAEYEACIKALELAKEKNLKKIQLCLDSMLVINQLSGRWYADFKFQKYIEKFNELKRYFDQIDFVFVRGEYNKAHEIVEEKLMKIEGYKVWSWRK